MKLKIMIMALLLVSAVGIGSAVNRMPATEFMGDIDFASGFYARNATEGIFNVKDYGAVGDGTTDDAPAIQTTIDAAAAAGGGIIYAPPGTYYLNSSQHATHAHIILEPRNNTYLVGSGIGATVFRLGDNYRDANGGAFMYYSYDQVENFGAFGITWDGNGANNLIIGGSEPGGTASSCKEWGGIGAYNARNAYFCNNEFTNWTGLWCIILTGYSRYPSWSSAATVENNIIRDCANAISENDQRDFAAIYVEVDNSTISGNRITTSTYSDVGSSIEIHAPNVICTENILCGLANGIFLTSDTNFDNDAMVIVSENIIDVNHNGVMIWGMNYAHGNLYIHDNQITVQIGNPIRHGGSTTTWFSGTPATQMLSICRNSVAIENAPTGGSAITLANNISTLIIEDNIITNASHYGILIIPSEYIDCLSISGNTIIDCGYDASGMGIFLNCYYTGLRGHVDNNYIWNLTQTMPTIGCIMGYLYGNSIDVQINWNIINPEASVDISTSGSLSGNWIVRKWGTSAPASGAHSIGSEVVNTAPSAAGVDRWRCTTTGTPGTWKSVNLSA